MQVARDEQGIWTVDSTEDERGQKGDYLPEFEKHLNRFDGLFRAAQAKDQFQFILSLLGIRGMQAAGWDAFENTVNAIDAAVRLHNEASDSTAAAHLRLWIYGHIVEASEPYELVANLLGIIDGGTFEAARFPDQSGRPQSPGAKMSWIEQRATNVGFPRVAEPFRSRWDRVLRNSIFHSDYALHGQEMRLVSAGERCETRRSSTGSSPLRTHRTMRSCWSDGPSSRATTSRLRSPPAASQLTRPSAR